MEDMDVMVRVDRDAEGNIVALGIKTSNVQNRDLLAVGNDMACAVAAADGPEDHSIYLDISEVVEK